MSLNHEPFDRNLRQALGELTRLKDKIAFQNKFLKKYSDLFERLGSEKGLLAKNTEPTSCRIEKIG